jgi:hypothetical protein
MLSYPGFVMRTAVAIATLLVFEGARAAVHAEEALRIALFKTASEDANLQSLAAAIDPVLLSELGSVPNLQVAARPALDLPSMQLAVDCVGETAECLARAAKEAQSEGLVAPLVRRIGAEVVVTLLLHDARKQTTITAATRRYSGQQVEDQVLDAIPGMVRELFGLQSAPVEQPTPLPPTAPSEAPELSSETSPPVAAAKPLPIVPIVVGAVGVALMAAGVGFGLSAKSTENDYAKLMIPKDDKAAAGRAQDKIDSAATQAMLSNLGIGVGAAAVAAGIVLFVLQSQSGDDHNAAQAASGMRLASGLAQLTLSGTWN